METNLNNSVLITVITVVYNGAGLLEKTILSVINQTYLNIEYIIIDGNSNDNTKEIIKKYEDRINIRISEPDRGIFDAMNKGIDLATGEWINFMNAGDCFFNNSVIELIFNHDNKQYDLIYGDCEYIYGDYFSMHKKTKDLDSIWKYMPFCHQSLFMKSDILKQYHFNINNLSADHELLYKCYIDNFKFLKTDLIIASYAAGGNSETNHIEVLKKRWDGVSSLTPSIKIDFFYYFFIKWQQMRNIIKKTMPRKLMQHFIRIKNMQHRI